MRGLLSTRKDFGLVLDGCRTVEACFQGLCLGFFALSEELVSESDSRVCHWRT